MIFKFIAIKLNEGSPLSKNLQPDVLYRFSEDYRFINLQGEETLKFNSYKQIIDIQDKQSYPFDLYKMEGVNPQMDITISAVVGKNGSGKSSLLEAFYQLIFCIAEGGELIDHLKDIEKKTRKSKDRGVWRTLKRNAENVLKNTQIELYFRQVNDCFVVRRVKGITEIHHLIAGEWVPVDISVTSFFYSIVVNYSQYSLNASWDYYWLKPLFHKNDGYLTPIVLNPFRDSGNIDINRESHLAQIRLLTNLSYEASLSPELIDDKEIDSVTFFLRPAKNGIIHDLGPDGEDSLTLLQTVGLHYPMTHNILLQYFDRLLKLFDPNIASKPFYKLLYDDLEKFLTSDPPFFQRYEENEKHKLTPDFFRLQLAVYILTKSIKICNKYPEKYRNYSQVAAYEEERTSISIRVISSLSLAQALFYDPSHITLKLKQTINLLISGYLANKDWERFADDQSDGAVAYLTDRPFKEVQQAIRDNFKNATYQRKHLSQFVPAAFLTPAIRIKSSKGNYLFTQMSSGEQQLIHSVHSVLYHMLNLNSIFEDLLNDKNSNVRKKGTRKMAPYKFVNLILDEIELYYHPLYQRRFVQFLLESLSKVSLPHIDGVQIIFSTHSPFILSDIPKSNVLKLQLGEPAAFQEDQTFGANIHDMLSDTFFLEGGHIGAFAEGVMEKCIAEIKEIRAWKILSTQTGYSNEEKEQAQKIIESLKDKRIYHDYEEAYSAERNSNRLRALIELIGEQIIRAKLLEMYDEAMPDDERARDDAKRQIAELMRIHNLNKENI